MKIICYLSLLLIPTLLLSQETTFSTTIDFEQNSETARSIITLNDSSFIALGDYLQIENTDSNFIVGNQGFILNKINSNGEILWSKNYYNEIGTYAGGLGGSSIKTSDNHILWGAAYGDALNISDFLLSKFNLEGDTIWTKRFGDTGYETGYRCIETSDGNYAMTGIKGILTDSLPYHYDAYLVKTDTAGQVLFEATYGEEQDDYGNALFALPNEQILLMGSSDFYGLDNHEAAHIRKIGEDGEVIQDWVMNQDVGRAAGQVIVSKDNHLVYMYVNDIDLFSAPNYKRTIHKIDTLGNEIWHYDFTENYPVQISSFRELADSSFILCGGHTDTPGNFYYSWLGRLSKDGELIWEQEYYVQPNRECLLYDVQPTLDGGFIAAGRTNQIGAQPDMWVLKVNCHGELAPANDCPPLIEVADTSVNNLNIPPTPHYLSITPNPSSDHSTIHWTNLPKSYYQLHIYESNGHLMEQIVIHPSETMYDLSVHHYPAGIYWVMLYNEKQLIAKQKLVVIN